MPVWVAICGPCTRGDHGRCEGACDCMDLTHGGSLAKKLFERKPTYKGKHRKDKK